MSILPLDALLMLHEKGKVDDLQAILMDTNARTLRDKLECEIRMLRSMMELAVTQEQSMTAEPVILLSRQLDRKINEFMYYKYKQESESWG